MSITKKRNSVLKELWQFMRVRKKLWLTPILLTLIALGILIFLSQGSVVAPFIYSKF